MAGYIKPIPTPNEDTAAFWEACKRHELTFKRCDDCGFYIHLPKPRCPECWSTNVSDAKVSGKGTIYTFTIVHVNTAPGFEPPYNVALVDLDEQVGLRIMTNIIDCANDDLVIGMPVEVAFHDVQLEDGELVTALPMFRPIQK